jgi:hypothetical protein
MNYKLNIKTNMLWTTQGWNDDAKVKNGLNTPIIQLIYDDQNASAQSQNFYLVSTIKI